MTDHDTELVALIDNELDGDAKDAARDCGANVIETNICAAEVLKRQLPEAQGAIYCGFSAKLIPTGKAPPCWGFLSAFDRSPQRAQAWEA
jgi:hypothetical protein